MRIRPLIPRGAGLARELKRIGVDPAGVRIMAPKSDLLVLEVDDLDYRAALILKQELLSRGAEAAISRRAYRLGGGSGPAILIGRRAEFEQLTVRLARQPFGLKELAGRLRSFLESVAPLSWQLAGRRLYLDRPLVMGILNITPDSFSDGGRYQDPAAALEQALRLEAEGADILDVGAESTRPGSRPISAEEERRRLDPVLKLLLPRLRLPVSVDTSKPEVARAALDAGAAVINDVTAGAAAGMFKLAARSGAGLVLMHMQGRPETMQVNPSYRDAPAEIYAFLAERLEAAAAAGVGQEQLVVDPGIGFGKSLEHNLLLLRRLGEFTGLGRPVLVGPSRKGFIGALTGLPMEARVEGTLAAVLAAFQAGASIFRVHDVQPVKRALAVAGAIRNENTGN
ncbi:MAG TPA: dihydropteroate synthase [bacterium]|nr:dihydropteroate synthase [bacterium]